MQVVYFIEYRNTIKFFQNDKTLEIPKTRHNMKTLCNLEKSFIFKKII